MNGQLLAAPELVFEAIPALEFDHTEQLVAEAGHDQWAHLAFVEPAPILELEFDHALSL